MARFHTKCVGFSGWFNMGLSRESLWTKSPGEHGCFHIQLYIKYIYIYTHKYAVELQHGPWKLSIFKEHNLPSIIFQVYVELPGSTVYLITMYIEKQFIEIYLAELSFWNRNIRLFPTFSSIPNLLLLEKVPPWTAVGNYSSKDHQLLGGWALQDLEDTWWSDGPPIYKPSGWCLNQPIWKVLHSQIGNLPQGSGWKFKTCLKPSFISHGVEWSFGISPTLPILMITMVRITTNWNPPSPGNPNQSPFPSLPFPIWHLKWFAPKVDTEEARYEKEWSNKENSRWPKSLVLQDGPPNYYFRGFIPSYTHLQPWLNRVCWGYNYLITRGAPSCKGLLDVLVPMYAMGNPYIRRV